MAGRRFVVIGGDAAGMSAASLAKRRQPELEIEAFEMGDYTSYGACGMPYYIGGEVPELEDLVVVTPDQFREKRGINVHMRHRVERIDPERKMVEVLDLDSETIREVSYDDLMIATGAEPVIPEGVDTGLKGVFTLRGLPDAGVIRQYALSESCGEAVVYGTGYIGMEMAEALTFAGLKVTVLGRRPQVMGVFEPEISDLAAKELSDRDIPVIFDARFEAVERTPEGRVSIQLAGDRALTTDLLVIGAGVSPRSELAARAGLSLGAKNAIAVDRRQRTSQENIWAAGDCSEVFHLLLNRNTYVPLALGANRQGRIVGHNIVGNPVEFPGILGTAICKVFDLTVTRTGLSMKEARAEGLDVEKVVVTSRSRAHYYPGSAPITSVLIVERGSKKLWGVQMGGRDGVSQRINTWVAGISAGMSLDDIYGLDLAYAPPFSPVWDPVLISSELAMKKVK